MAQPTTTQPQPPPHQAPTHGVGTTPGSMKPSPGMQGAVQKPDTEGAKPTLFEDLDPVLLARLYPDSVSKGLGDARAQAMKAGEQDFEQGKTLEAAAQDPGDAKPEGQPKPGAQRA